MTNNKLDNLALETFLDIFEYLSPIDRFKAFDNLNFKINSALRLAYLSIDLTSISNQIFTQFYCEKIFSDHIHQIRALKISNESTLGALERLFTNVDLNNFEQLRSLTLIKPSYMILADFALHLPYFKQLEYLSIDALSYPVDFFFQITTTSPSLKSCHVPGLKICEEFSSISQIEHLTVSILDVTVLLQLLVVFPRIQYFDVSLIESADELIEFDKKIISCQHLEIFKIRLIEKSNIDFDQIEFFFKQISFNHLKHFSYHCSTELLNHIDTTRWNQILISHLSTIASWNFYVEIPHRSCSLNDIEQAMKTCPCETLFDVSMSHSFYIVHSCIYPKVHFDLPLESSDLKFYSNYNPTGINTEKKYTRVKSLTIGANSISHHTILPTRLQHLNIRGNMDDLTVSKRLGYLGKQLISLKLNGLPDTLPTMSHLRQLTVQQVPFNLKMTVNLARLCPRLESLNIEIDRIKKFGQIFANLRQDSKLTELKFLRVFSRDTKQSWSNWIQETTVDNVILEARYQFLFIWL